MTLVDLWDEHARIVQARITAYSFYRDVRLMTHHVFDYVLIDVNGNATSLTITLRVARREYRHLDPHEAVARMVDTIARTPTADLAMLVEMHFAAIPKTM